MTDRSEVIFSYEDEDLNKKQIQNTQNVTARDIEYGHLYFSIDVLITLIIYFLTNNIFFACIFWGYTELVRHLRALNNQNTRILSTLLIIANKIDKLNK